MTDASFCQELEERISKYDLLSHPYYRDWSEGRLTRDNIKSYACNYYHHVAAFPLYLDKLQSRLPEGALKSVVLRNKEEEEVPGGTSHADLWLDFAEGMGADRSEPKQQQPISEIGELVNEFEQLAAKGTPAQALAAFYAYESQIPRVSAEKERSLKEFYGADDKTGYYFTLHRTYDIKHANVWLEHLLEEVRGNDDARKSALNAAEKAAKALWKALDGVDLARRSGAPATEAHSR